MKRYTRKHGIIIANGVLLSKTEKYSTTRWNVIRKNILDKQEKYNICMEENCSNSIFIYDKNTSIVCYDICNLEHTILNEFIKGGDVFERIINLAKETELDKLELLKENMLQTYIIHIWR